MCIVSLSRTSSRLSVAGARSTHPAWGAAIDASTSHPSHCSCARERASKHNLFAAKGCDEVCRDSSRRKRTDVALPSYTGANNRGFSAIHWKYETVPRLLTFRLLKRIDATHADLEHKRTDLHASGRLLKGRHPPRLPHLTKDSARNKSAWVTDAAPAKLSFGERIVLFRKVRCGKTMVHVSCYEPRIHPALVGACAGCGDA